MTINQVAFPNNQEMGWHWELAFIKSIFSSIKKAEGHVDFRLIVYTMLHAISLRESVQYRSDMLGMRVLGLR